MLRRRLSSSRVVNTITAVSLLVFVGTYLRPAHLSARQPIASSPTVELSPQPTGWQPFEAQLTVTKPGAPTLSGRYYRASDGSDRYEESTADGTISVVTIVNVSAGRQYICDLVHSCCTRQATDTTRPVGLRRVTTPGLVKSDQRIEGYELYVYTDGSGQTHLQAPALNFAELVSHRADGSVFVLTHIALGEPSPSLFQPPAVATTVDLVWPPK